jgi:hypothetical protein
MKKHRKHREGGGQTAGEKDFGKPRDDWKAEEGSKPKDYTADDPDVAKEAEEKKRGGRAKRARGGGIHKIGIHAHRESGKEDMKHLKHIGKVSGNPNFHAGRAPRKSGGGVGSDKNPFSSARPGTPPRDHKVEAID